MIDPIVEEVRQIRARIAEECDYDLEKIVQHAHETAKRIPGLRYVTKEQLRARRADRAPALAENSNSQK